MEDTLNDSQNNKDALVKERGQRVRSRFRKEAISGVNDPKLLEVLGFVCDYWKDNFRPAFVTLCCEAVGGQAGAADDVGLMMSLTSAGGGIHDDIVDKSSNDSYGKVWSRCRSAGWRSTNIKRLAAGSEFCRKDLPTQKTLCSY